MNDNIDYIPPEIMHVNVDIGDAGRIFMSSLQQGPNLLLGANFSSNDLTQIYTETVRQVFDIITPNFQDFSLELQCLPNWDYLINGQLILANLMAANALRESIKLLGMSIWMTLQTDLFFSQPMTFIIERVTIDAVLLRIMTG